MHWAKLPKTLGEYTAMRQALPPIPTSWYMGGTPCQLHVPSTLQVPLYTIYGRLLQRSEHTDRGILND